MLYDDWREYCKPALFGELNKLYCDSDSGIPTIYLRMYTVRAWFDPLRGWSHLADCAMCMQVHTQCNCTIIYLPSAWSHVSRRRPVDGWTQYVHGTGLVTAFGSVPAAICIASAYPLWFRWTMHETLNGTPWNIHNHLHEASNRYTHKLQN